MESLVFINVELLVFVVGELLVFINVELLVFVVGYKGFG